MLRTIRHIPAILAAALLLGAIPFTAYAGSSRAAAKCPPAVVVHKLPKDTSNNSKVAVISFGIQGGNIRPFMVTLALDGTITATGATVPSQKLTDPQNTLKGLLAMADAEGFFSMPTNTRCAGVNPDVGAPFITLYSSTKVKHVQVDGSCVSKFSQLYSVLRQVAGVNR